MPLLNEHKSEEDKSFALRWYEVRNRVKNDFGQRPDINAMLFLIGINEVGIVKEKWEKEEKQDLMHVAICKLFSSEGYFKFLGNDDEGWPQYEVVENIPKLVLKDQDESKEIFGTMFRTSPLLAIEKSVLNLAVLLISLFSYEWLKNHKHLPEFFMLLFSSLLGFFFMMSSNNLLMFYLGLELSTIPLAALCNFDLDKKVSSEAAMKMIMSSAFSSAILLFGISMLYGTTGSLDFAVISQSLVGNQLQILAFILVLTGFAFKLSIVPFHLWTADVYEGSPIAVTAYLSVVSKGAMAFVFITSLYTVFAPLAMTWFYAVAGLAAVTITVGNIFALRQQNLKRFFGFSSIAQVGYLLIAISSASQIGVASVVYFILIYVFTNLAAFAIISVISSVTGKETVNDYKGLYASNPTLALVMSLALFSLAGIPPTAGFFGKLFLLTTGAQTGMWWLIIIASLNLVVSLYYYLRIVRAMFVDENSEPMEKISLATTSFAAVCICVAGILVLGFVSRTFDVILQFAANL